MEKENIESRADGESPRESPVEPCPEAVVAAGEVPREQLEDALRWTENFMAEIRRRMKEDKPMSDGGRPPKKLSAELRMRFPSLTRVRKSHRCRLCDEPIPKGDSCCSWTTFNDVPETHYAHPECYQVTLDEEWDDCDWECTFPGEDFVRPGADPMDSGVP
jgi:hypothetical protein